MRISANFFSPVINDKINKRKLFNFLWQLVEYLNQHDTNIELNYSPTATSGLQYFSLKIANFQILKQSIGSRMGFYLFNDQNVENSF